MINADDCMDLAQVYGGKIAPEDDVRVDAVVSPKGENCDECGKFVEGFEYKTCCNGFDCGCMGRPVEPCICSEKCWNKMMKG